jgi:hypothetical protein
MERERKELVEKLNDKHAAREKKRDDLALSGRNKVHEQLQTQLQSHVKSEQRKDAACKKLQANLNTARSDAKSAQADLSQMRIERDQMDAAKGEATEVGQMWKRKAEADGKKYGKRIDSLESDNAMYMQQLSDAEDSDEESCGVEIEPEFGKAKKRRKKMHNPVTVTLPAMHTQTRPALEPHVGKSGKGGCFTLRTYSCAYSAMLMGLMQCGVQCTKLLKVAGGLLEFIAPAAVRTGAVKVPSLSVLHKLRPRMQLASEAMGALMFAKSMYAIVNHDGASIEQEKVFGNSHSNSNNNVYII